MVTLQKLIQRMETSAVSVKTMKELMPDGVDVLVYEQLKGKQRKQLFTNKRGIVVLIPKEGTKTGHFIALLPRKNHIEYFSSLGNSFESELKMLKQKQTYFHTLLGSDYIYNRVKLQSGDYSIKTCAQYVFARMILYKLKLREFVEIFKRNVDLETPDEIVSLMSVLHFLR
jgi:hypothetical protein